MRKLNIFSIVMSLLSMLTIFSVGFSGWVSMPPAQDSASGSFSTYEVGEMSKYISMSSIDMFEYSALHFWNSDQSAASDTGTISVKYRIDLDACATDAGDDWDNTLSVTANLWYNNLATDYALFTDTGSGAYSKTITVAIEGVDDAASDITGDMITTTHTFTNLENTGTFDFTVVYTFNIPMNLAGTTTPSNFRNCFGKYLKAFAEDPTTFNVSALVDW